MSDQTAAGLSEQLISTNDEIRSEILDDADASIVVTDLEKPDMPIIYVNRAFCQMTGYEKEEVIGRNCRFLQGPETSKASKSIMRHAIENREFARVVVVNYRKNGEKFYNEINLAPVSQKDDHVKYYLSVQFDITEDFNAYSTFEQSLIHELLQIKNGEV